MEQEQLDAVREQKQDDLAGFGPLVRSRQSAAKFQNLRPRQLDRRMDGRRDSHPQQDAIAAGSQFFGEEFADPGCLHDKSL
jgi:hypothetical protein